MLLSFFEKKEYYGIIIYNGDTMSYLRIFNLQFNKYQFTTTFEENIVYGVYCPCEEIRTQFLKLITGINNSLKAVLYNDNEAFENKEYFRKRLYIDFKNKYLKTLNANAIKEAINMRFQKEFNIKNYKDAVTMTNIRSEVKLTNEYSFTMQGVTLSSYCLFKGLNYQYNIIDNPTFNITNPELKKKIYVNICKKELNPIITFDNLTDAKQYCDKLIVIGDFPHLYQIDLKNDSFMLSDDNIILRKRIFKVNDSVISINTYSKEELKYLSKNKVKYKFLNFSEIIKLLGGNRNQDEK